MLQTIDQKIRVNNETCGTVKYLNGLDRKLPKRKIAEVKLSTRGISERTRGTLDLPIAPYSTFKYQQHPLILYTEVLRHLSTILAMQRHSSSRKVRVNT